MDINQKRGNRKMNKNKVTNWILLITLIIVFVSGGLIRPMGDSMMMLAVHKLSAVIFVVFNIVHILQHRKRKGNSYVS